MDDCGSFHVARCQPRPGPGHEQVDKLLRSYLAWAAGQLNAGWAQRAPSGASSASSPLPPSTPFPGQTLTSAKTPRAKRVGLHLPLQNLSLLSACQKQRIYYLIHFEQNLFLEIFMMEE